MASYNGGLNGVAHCSSIGATSGESLGPLATSSVGREEGFKSQFKTREGTYRNMVDAEHRPLRTPGPGYSTGSNLPVRVTFITMPHPLDQTFGRDRICFNVGREIFVCDHNGLKAPPDTKNPVDKRVYKGTSPTCHDFNPLTVSVDRVLLVIGFSAGQIQLVDPIKKEDAIQTNKLYNEDRLIDRTKVNSIKWVPGSTNVFLAAHSSGHLYVYKEDLICGQTPPVYQVFKQGDGFIVYTCKAKSTRNPLYKWTIGEGSLNEISFSPCSKFMATVSQDGFLRIFSYDTMDLVGRMRSYFGGLLSLAWSPDSKFVAVGGEDDLISVWSMNQKRVVARGQGHKSWVSVIAFDPYCTMYRDSDDGVPSDEEIGANAGHSETNSPPSDGNRASSASEPLVPSCEHSRQITSYRIGSVGQDTHLCLWDLTDDVLRQPVGRSRTSILLHSPAQEQGASLLNNSGNSASGASEGSSGTLKVKNKEKRFPTLGSSRSSDKNGVSKSSQSGTKGDDPNKLLGTGSCPRLEEAPMLEPLICKKISHERLTALVFREDSFVVACQEGFVSVWARPAYGQLILTPAQSVMNEDMEEVEGREAINTIV